MLSNAFKRSWTAVIFLRIAMEDKDHIIAVQNRTIAELDARVKALELVLVPNIANQSVPCARS
jgi:hypothetical protein